MLKNPRNMVSRVIVPQDAFKEAAGNLRPNGRRTGITFWGVVAMILGLVWRLTKLAWWLFVIIAMIAFSGVLFGFVFVGSIVVMFFYRSIKGR